MCRRGAVEQMEPRLSVPVAMSSLPAWASRVPALGRPAGDVENPVANFSLATR